MKDERNKLSIIDRLIVSIPAAVGIIGCNFISGTYSDMDAYRQMQKGTAVVRDIDSDGLEDIVLQREDGKPLMAFVNKDGKYVSLKEYAAQQEAQQEKAMQDKYQEYLK